MTARVAGRLAASLVVLGVAAGGAFAQVPEGSPRAELGVDVSAGPHGDGEWSSIGGRVSLNLDSRTAIDGILAPELDRDQYSHVDYLTVQLRRSLHDFETGTLFGAVGATFARRSIDPGFFGDDFYRGERWVSRTVGASFALGVTFDLAPYAALRGETQYVLGENSLLRFSGGLAVPIGEPFPRATDVDVAALAGTPAARVKGGQTVWVTSRDGREYKGEIAGRSPDALTLRHSGGATTLTLADIDRIEAPDRLINGFLIGASSGGVAGAVFGGILGDLICEGSSGCVFIGSTLVGGMGAGLGGLVGTVIDGFHDNRRTVFRRNEPAPRVELTLAPMVTRSASGVTGVVRW